jgi:hypothetical protein
LYVLFRCIGTIYQEGPYIDHKADLNIFKILEFCGIYFLIKIELNKKQITKICLESPQILEIKQHFNIMYRLKKKVF